MQTADKSCLAQEKNAAMVQNQKNHNFKISYIFCFYFMKENSHENKKIVQLKFESSYAVVVNGLNCKNGLILNLQTSKKLTFILNREGS